jgi:hypothetical protein
VVVEEADHQAEVDHQEDHAVADLSADLSAGLLADAVVQEHAVVREPVPVEKLVLLECSVSACTDAQESQAVFQEASDPEQAQDKPESPEASKLTEVELPDVPKLVKSSLLL